MVIFSAGRSPQALQPLLVSAPGLASAGANAARGNLHTLSHITSNIATLTAYHPPRPPPLAPCPPPFQAADTPSLTPRSTSHASFLTPLGPRRRHVGGRRSSGRRSRLRLGGRHSQHWRIRGAKTSFVGTARLIAASPKIESTFRREMPARWLMCWSKRRSRALAC
jgi:hypothetical protein